MECRSHDRAVLQLQSAVPILQALVDDYRTGCAWLNQARLDNADGRQNPYQEVVWELLACAGGEVNERNQVPLEPIQDKLQDHGLRRQYLGRMLRNRLQDVILLTWNQHHGTIDEVSRLVKEHAFPGSDEILADLHKFALLVERDGIEQVTRLESFAIPADVLRDTVRILVADGGAAALLVPMSQRFQQMAQRPRSDDLTEENSQSGATPKADDELPHSDNDKDCLGSGSSAESDLDLICKNAASAYRAGEFAYAAFETFQPTPRFPEVPDDYSPALICYACAIEAELVERPYSEVLDVLAQDRVRWPDAVLKKGVRRNQAILAKAVLNRRNDRRETNPPLGTIATYFKEGVKSLRRADQSEGCLFASWIVALSTTCGYNQLLCPGFIHGLHVFTGYRNDAAHARSVERSQFFVSRRLAYEILTLLSACRTSSSDVEQHWEQQYFDF